MTTQSVNDLVNPSPDHTYRNYQVPESVYKHPAMLGYQERVLPAYLASHELPGTIVELGCYLGGSTVSLLAGLRQAGRLEQRNEPLIQSYDLFVANEYMVSHHALGDYGVTPNGSFEHVFRSLLGDELRYVEVHAGDICQRTWTGGPIGLLFVDMLWGWELNHHVIDQFYRSLVPGSWLIHQDFSYSRLPWLPISMEWFVRQGYFTYHAYAEAGTVSFRCEKSLDDFPTNFDFSKHLSLEEKQHLIQGAADRFVGYPHDLIGISECYLFFEAGYSAEFCHQLARYLTADSTHEYSLLHRDMVCNDLRAVT